jgi:hypothetical protein
MLSRLPFLLAPLWLLAALGAQAPVVTETSEFYPADTEQQNGDERWLTHRIVDALTGAPIAGAELMLLAESEHPLRGESWTGQRAASDGDGFVRLRVEEQKPGEPKPNWFLIRARGYGAAMFGDRVPTPIVPLSPSVPLPVQLVDWLGKPVSGALVSFCGGGGRSPDLAHGRTDAQGMVTLVDIDPQNPTADLFVEHPGLGLGFRSFPWYPGMAPIRFQIEPSPSITGVLLDQAGKPVADAYVGTTDQPRGPWTRTGKDGSFALHGGNPRGELHVHTGKRHVVFQPVAVGAPCKLQLPKPNGKKPQVIEPPERKEVSDELVLVKVSILDAEQTALGNGTFRFVGPLPKRDETSGTADRDDARAFVLPGKYELWVGGDDHVETRLEVTVTADGDNEVKASPKPLPSVAVQVVELPETGSVWLRTADGSRDVSEAVRAGKPIGVPDGPFWFVLHGDRDQRRLFAFDRAQALAKAPLSLAWWPATRVTGKVVDAKDQPCAAAVAMLPIERTVTGFDAGTTVETTEQQGTLDLPTQLDGLAFLLVRDPSEQAAPQMLAVVLPPRGEKATVDVGTITLGGAPALLLKDGTGAPLSGTAGLVRQGWHDVRATPPQFPLGADGAFLGPRPQAGDTIVVPEIRTGEDGRTTVIDLPVRFPLTGKGPWNFTLPRGGVRLDVQDGNGKELPVGVTIGSEHERIEGPMLLRRLPPGKLRLYVAAEEHLGALVDVVVPADGVVEAKVVLKAR